MSATIDDAMANAPVSTVQRHHTLRIRSQTPMHNEGGKHEYFHGDNGAGLGASHQTGWTGVIAAVLDLFGRVSKADALTTPEERLRARLVQEQVRGA